MTNIELSKTRKFEMMLQKEIYKNHPLSCVNVYNDFGTLTIEFKYYFKGDEKRTIKLRPDLDLSALSNIQLHDEIDKIVADFEKDLVSYEA